MQFHAGEHLRGSVCVRVPLVAVGKPLGYFLLESLAVTSCFRALRSVLPPINNPAALEEPSGALRSDDKVLFDKSKFLLTVHAMAATLFTFGVVFPPLIGVILVAAWSHTAYTEVVIGRLLLRAQELGLSGLVDARVDRDCSGLHTTLRHVITVTMYFAAFFYSLFVFDTVGGRAGLDTGIVAMVLMFLMPYLVHLFVYLWSTALRHKRTTAEAAVDAASHTVENPVSDLRLHIGRKEVEVVVMDI